MIARYQVMKPNADLGSRQSKDILQIQTLSLVFDMELHLSKSFGRSALGEKNYTEFTSV
jgi:hypothetical protein